MDTLQDIKIMCKYSVPLKNRTNIIVTQILVKMENVLALGMILSVSVILIGQEKHAMRLVRQKKLFSKCYGVN